MFYRFLLLVSCYFFLVLGSTNYAQTFTQESFDSINVRGKKINLYLIPVGSKKISRDITRQIGKPFQKAKITIESAVLPELRFGNRSNWNNPFADHKQFTKEMKQVC